MSALDLHPYGIRSGEVLRNAPPALLYEHAAAEGDLITASGALAAFSGEKTGRSPKDKRIVDDPSSSGDVWWGPVNIPLGEDSFLACRQRAVEFLSSRPRLYVVDGFGGWDPQHRLKIRVIAER